MDQGPTPQGPVGGPPKRWGFWVLQGVGQVVMGALTRPVWEGIENVPAGPALIVSNHISNADPVVLGHALVAAGHVPRYMAKRELFDVPALGALLRSAGQIPVTRVAGQTGAAYEAALASLQAGEQVVVYPEGTLTRDPDGWPMRGKTGVARLALQTQVPVIPVGQWGAQDVWPAGARLPGWGRRDVRIRFGPPVGLDDLRDVPVTADVLRRATDRILHDVTHLVAQVRGIPAPRAD